MLRLKRFSSYSQITEQTSEEKKEEEKKVIVEKQYHSGLAIFGTVMSFMFFIMFFTQVLSRNKK